MEKFLTYLACPYSHPDPKVREDRYRAANEAAVVLIRAFRWNVFSPITHSHPMHELGLDGDWKFWESIDLEYLGASRRIVVLTIPGWLQSTGVGAEHRAAKKLGLEVLFMSRPEVNIPASLPPSSELTVVTAPYVETRFYLGPVPGDDPSSRLYAAERRIYTQKKIE